jgi:hypothetical protein
MSQKFYKAHIIYNVFMDNILLLKKVNFLKFFQLL